MLAEKMSDELILVHEAEIESMRECYRQNQEMFEKVAKRQQLWEEMLDLEVCFFRHYLLLLLVCFDRRKV